MKRTMMVCSVALLLASALRAEAPFGRFGGTADGSNGGGGIISFQGWALDDSGVAAVDIYVDGRIAGRAEYGKPRTEVPFEHPGYPDSAAAGFAYNLDTTHYLNGKHLVSARVLSRTGETRFLPEVHEILFTNTDHTLRPFGRITFPNDNVEMRGRCDISDPTRRYSVVTGYALDAGVSEGDMGIGWVELLIDGAVFANDQVSCYYSDATGGYSNCYGLRSLDVEQKYPFLRNAPHAGFRFVLDVGALINFGYSRGHHILTIRAGDIFTQVRNIDEIPVTFQCDEDIENEAAFGRIGVPKNGNMYSGLVEVVGWALDWEGVRRVIVYVDGKEVGDAQVRLTRPEVASLYPGYPESNASGYRFLLDTTELSDGAHHLQVKVRDQLLVDTLIGERVFRVNNDTSD
jgi:hypothetical protein